MSDSNMNAKTEAAEHKNVSVDESQPAISPDTSKNDAIPESQRPVMPEEDKRRLRAMRGAKCVPDILGRILGEATKDHVDTPSEKIVKLAKERDILFDMINNKKEDLEKEQDKSHSEFLKEYIAALASAKDVITRRIMDLLSQT